MSVRFIPKKLTVKKTIYKCYSLKDLSLALLLFFPILSMLLRGNVLPGVILLLFCILLFIPTGDGILWEILLEQVRFLFSKKKYNPTELQNLLKWKNLSPNGILTFTDHTSCGVLHLHQKNFSLEDHHEQDMDIHSLSLAFSSLAPYESLDLIKIERPVTLGEYSQELFYKTQQKALPKTKKELLEEELGYMDELNNKHQQYMGDFYLVLYSKNEGETERSITHMQGDLQALGILSERLDERDVQVFLRYCENRCFDERQIQMKKGSWFFTRKDPIKIKNLSYKRGNIETSTMVISSYPNKVGNAWGASLFSIPNTKVVMHITPVEGDKAVKRIDKCLGDLDTKTIFSERISDASEAEVHKESLLKLLENLQSENEVLLDTTTLVTSYNYQNKDHYKSEIKRAITRLGFKVSNLSARQREGFLYSSVTPKNHLTPYECGINSSSCAAVFPFVRSNITDKGGRYLGENLYDGYPFLFNIWKRSPIHQNSNGMVIGKSGSGKSYFLKTLLASEYSRGTNLIILDPENEYVTLTHNLGGVVIDVGNAKEGVINPFHIYPVLEDGGNTQTRGLAYHTQLKVLESFLKLTMEGAPPITLELINRELPEVYRGRGITSDTDISHLTPKDFPVFSDLYNQLQRKAKDPTNPFQTRYQEALLYVEKFVCGRYGELWGVPTTLETNSNVLTFSFQSLFANKNQVVANAQMLLIFRLLEQELMNKRVKNEGGNHQNTLIVCDEAHLFIDEKYPIALDFFYSMSKRIRKYDGCFLPATQNIADWNANETLRHKTSAIIKNSQYHFFFKLSPPDVGDVLELYRGSGMIGEEECDTMMHLQTGEMFFLSSGGERMCVRVHAGKRKEGYFTTKQT